MAETPVSWVQCATCGQWMGGPGHTCHEAAPFGPQAPSPMNRGDQGPLPKEVSWEDVWEG